MSFSVNIQRNNSDVNVLNKDISDLVTMTGNLKAGTSVINPVILFEGQPPMDANYMTISEFGRKYFITNITIKSGNLYEVSARVDVLSTYASQIRNCYGIVARQENAWNLYVDDGTFKIYQMPENTIKLFPSGFNKYEFVLAVAGS